MNELVAAYESGISSNQLVIDYGIAKGTVLKLLRANNATMRRQGLNAVTAKQAATLYRDGKSLAAIGEKFGVNPTTVRSALVKQNIALRDSHGRDRNVD
ncbi:helix-turn-helix domain-containing protein [Mycobacteroides abscessus]|uniref:helix-turn-helix domain-containing protein n=1 Tax=Mycobacteroides abscessus TaxID=36809 RepID=UPI000C2632EE|nr:helix-turn-helix domain containing protein [Mycobacteroides abscessus]